MSEATICALRARISGVLITASLMVTACVASTPVARESVAQPSEPSAPEGLQLLAHRGVHQTFNRDGLDDQTCTATRIDPPTHKYLENTLPSIEAAFAAGASVVEIDIAPSIDGVLAVFHDWGVSCRTDGRGEIRSLTWAELSKLDIGYGYSADGKTFPLRGDGVGLMPRLEDVFGAFPDGQFLINFKSDDTAEAVLLQEVVEAEDAAHQIWAVYGAGPAVETYVSNTGTRGFSESSVTACLLEYVAAATTLEACRDTVVVVPTDIAPMLTGWPEAFAQTMRDLGTHIIVSGPNRAGIDTSEDFDRLPEGIDAYVWTDRVEAVG